MEATNNIPPKPKKLGAAVGNEFYGGEPRELGETELPTFRDIVRYWHLLQQRGTPKVQAFAMITEQLVDIWNRVLGEVPLIVTKSLYNKVKRFLVKVTVLKHRQKLSETQRIFMDSQLDTLFDICKCVCPLAQRRCDHPRVGCRRPSCKEAHILCDCPLEVNTYM